ncbi:MAG: enoyl-CoA hydratase/isomerase family protein [Actinobacteria bacterium]|nr:enoyl-CoA hydratase/isomerase family protein [Actinomycetota bacterium]
MAVEVSIEEGVELITLSRPEVMNTFTRELHKEFAEALRAARGDDVRAVIITGEGRAFSAGQDLEEVQREGGGNDDRLRRHYNPNAIAIYSLEKPVIAAVNGACAGAGLSLAAAADVRLASAKAKFVPAFVNLGLIPDAGCSWFLPRIIGEAKALEWMISGRRIDAEEALAIGLVSEVVEPDDLLTRAQGVATQLAAWPGDGVGTTKRLIQRSLRSSLADHLELEVQVQAYAASTPAYLEAMEEFLSR